MSYKSSFIAKLIKAGKPVCQANNVGTKMYYENVDGTIGESSVVVAAGETVCLANGDWCYGWQLVAVSTIPEAMRL